MFAKNKVSQSLIDAVNKIMSEKEVESKEELLSEGWDEMLKSVKDKNKPQPSGGAGKKQGSRYGGSKQKEEPEEKEVKEELKGNQHKIDKNKNNKIDAHDFQLLRGRKKVKEDTFAAKLLNSLDERVYQNKTTGEIFGTADKPVVKPTAPAAAPAKTQSELERVRARMAASKTVRLNNSFELDETRGAQAMKDSGVKQSPDKLLARTGMNMAHKFPRPGQTNLGNIPGMNTPGVSKSTKDFGDKMRLNRAKELKPAIKAASGTHGPKGKLPEQVSEELVDFNIDPLTGKMRDEVEILTSGYDKKLKPTDVMMLEEGTSPKKGDDAMAGKQNLTPAKKGVVGTVKSDFNNFKNFLAGKKETNEEVESLDEDRYLMKYLLSRGINPKYVDRNTRVGHAKSNEFKKWKADHLNSLIVTRESNEMPFDGPYTKTKKDVKDKSGAVHTPMSRARNLARAALKSVQDKTKIK